MAFEQFMGTRPVAPQHAFDLAALGRWMAQHVEGCSGELKVEQFKGGQSNPTFLVEAGGQRYVLRRKPPGELLPSAHAVDREFRVISALANTEVPVAKAHALVRGQQRDRRDVLHHGLRRRPGAVGSEPARHRRVAAARLLRRAQSGDRGHALRRSCRGGAGRLRQAGQLHRAPGRSLDQAVSGGRDGPHRGRGAPDRMAAGAHPAGR